MNSQLGIFVLMLLDARPTHGLVMMLTDFDEPVRWAALASLMVIVVGVIGGVGFSVARYSVRRPEHSNPLLDDSALRDQIEDVLASQPSQECPCPGEK